MNRWLWYSGVGLLSLVLLVGLALVVALLLGLNSPRPIRPPDWQAADLPTALEASPNTTVVRLLKQSCDDFILEGEAIPLSGPDSGFNGYGLLYRAQDDAHYYAFAVGSDGYYAVLRIDGDEQAALMDWQQFPHIRRGTQTNRLRVACEGASCRFYVNDEYATTVEDATWLEGDVGLWVRSFEKEPVSIQFEGVRVWVEWRIASRINVTESESLRHE
jgi:hypothetical protein